MRRLAGVELLTLDDFALQPLDATETAPMLASAAAAAAAALPLAGKN